MIRAYRSEAGRLQAIDSVFDAQGAPLWVDLLNPTDEEEKRLEAQLGIEIPTREEMQEIEISSRLYTEDDITFLTAIVPAHSDGDDPEMGPVTFVLAPDVLITVRYHEPHAFRTFPLRAEKMPMGADTGKAMLISLLEAIVDRLADVLERAGGDIDAISREVFRQGSSTAGQIRDFRKVLESIGRKGDLTSKIRDSLVTLERLIGFLGLVDTLRKSDKDLRERVKTLYRDVRSLTDHAGFLEAKITFLLDATLGMISIEQNGIIKILSVAAVVFLPPTLIASIYGMNFQHMPELSWPWGYPAAIGLMALSAILPFLYFKRRGWL